MEDGGTVKESDVGDVSRFLNRLLGLKVTNQNMVSCVNRLLLHTVGLVLIVSIYYLMRIASFATIRNHLITQ